MNVWATSDWHFGHRKIREYCPSRMDNFESVIAENFNRMVQPGDTVYFLGDMVLRGGAEGRQHWELIATLCRDIDGILVPGNHDHFTPSKLIRVGGFKKVVPEFTNYTTSTGNKLLLSHVPMVATAFDERYNGWRRRVREEFARGEYDLNIHGHTHERHTGDSQCVNVSIEATDYMPALLDVIEQDAENPRTAAQWEQA